MALDFFAGCVGGCAGVLVGHPFDTVKVRIQTQNFTNVQYKGAFDCFAKIIRNESFSGLYKGMSSPMVGVAAVNAIIFGVYGNIQRRLPDPDSLTSHFVAGTAAGLLQSFICSPMEMIKTRLQIQNSNQYKNPMDCLSHIYKTEGFRGVFRGLNITLLREGPGFGSYFVCYEFLTRKESPEPISTPHMLMAGGTAGAVSWLLAYPIDVIKSRIQVDGMSGPRLYKNSIDCLIKSVKGEGISCLAKGLTPTLLRAFPTNAATWAAVTWVFRLAKGNSLETDYYQTLSELIESTKVQNMLAASIATLPDLLYKNHSLYLINHNDFFPKNYFFIQNVRAESDFLKKDKIEISRKKENREKEEKQGSMTDSKGDNSEEKSKDDFRPKSITLQEDETTKSKIYKCEKEMSSFETFFVNLCKVTTKSYS